MALCVPFVLLLLLAEPLLLAAGQDAELAASAAHFCMLLAPGVPPLVVFLCLTKFLQSQDILAPCVYVGLLGNPNPYPNPNPNSNPNPNPNPNSYRNGNPNSSPNPNPNPNPIPRQPT